jgi:predicted RND superfamily exporter protein
MLENLYNNFFLKYPKIIFTSLLLFTAVMFIFAMRLEIDASADTLLLEGDKDLAFARTVSSRFTTKDVLVVTYTIKDDLLSETNIQNIKSLGEKLQSLAMVDSINSIINVPLLQSPIRPLTELSNGIRTLMSKNIDKELVKKEFLNSAIYKDNLVSNDFKTTGILINLKRENKYFSLLKNKQEAIENKDEQKINIAKIQLKKYRDLHNTSNHELIVNIRKIIDVFHSKHKDIKLHLGGVTMVADDMVEFVKYDLKIFSYLIVFLLIIVLYVLLKQKRWVFISLFISAVSLIITSGVLGFFGLEITIVSSNFISLQLIMNISLIIHLTIKYKDLAFKNKDYSQEELITKTMTSMFKPSFFVVITTIAGFASLMFSNILPIINFGWMMSGGIIVSLIMTFILFPILLIFFDKTDTILSDKENSSFTMKLAHIAYSYKKTILVSSILLVIFSITGASKLRVENSFIDYFKKDTYIYQGMALIDQKLGGTTPLDVIITFKDNSDEVNSVAVSQESNELDEFEDEFTQDEQDKEQYWFTQNKMQKIKQVHNYLETIEGIGKVLSLATVGEIIKKLNNSKEADGLTLALIYQKLPQEYKDIVLSPYLDITHNQVRITTRVIDSLPGLQRNELIQKINTDIAKILNPKYEDFRTSGLLIMYNNMLQSLFKSQIQTIGVVVLILFMMFLILFRSLKIAIVAIVVNTTPVFVIFGFMGWINIPLDIMTITIAAISIGIAVDNTIHYIYRFKEELNQDRSLKDAMFNSHGSIGRAMFYTTTIIMIGFSVLVLSNFLPTIYFGLLTLIAMFMAILSDLLLLPVLLLMFSPKKENI